MLLFFFLTPAGPPTDMVPSTASVTDGGKQVGGFCGLMGAKENCWRNDKLTSNISAQAMLLCQWSRGIKWMFSPPPCSNVPHHLK